MLGEQETLEPGDAEAGPLDRRDGVAAEMAAAEQVRPHGGVQGALDPGEPGGVGADVFEEARQAAGLEYGVDLPQRCVLVGTVHSTIVTMAASKLASAAGSALARPSVTVTGTGAVRAAAVAIWRSRGSGSIAITRSTAGG